LRLETRIRLDDREERAVRSPSTAKRPAGVSVGGTETLPPSSVAFAAVASLSATAK
jgi:hypothetical protein